MEHVCRLCGQSMLGSVRRSTRAIEDCQAERTPSRPALRLVPTEPKPTPPRVPRVSDHAKLRLAEHLYGLDSDALERALLTPAVRNAIKAGAFLVRRPDGLRLRIAEDGTIVTVLPKEVNKKMYQKGRVVRTPEPDVRQQLAEQFREFAEGALS